MDHSQVVERLGVLNAPHPRRMWDGLRDPRQLARSWYILLFQIPWVPERMLRASRWGSLRHGFQHDARSGTFTPTHLETYIAAWSQPGAATAMINYYRAAVRQGPWRAKARLRPLRAPTLIIWGERDRYLGTELADPERTDVPNLERVVRLPNASHWVHHDERERVTQLLAEFFVGARKRACSP